MKRREKIRRWLNGAWLVSMMIGFSLSLPSCISDYEPEGIDLVSGLLVVDGIITNGETRINLRRSVGLTDDFTDEEFVNDAKVTVEREDGTIYPATLTTRKGEYAVGMGELDGNLSYRLRISQGGQEYESDYLRPVFTPPIDSISLMKKGPGQDVYLCVSTHGSQDGSRYYRWMYKENWELKAEMMMQAQWVDKKLVMYDLGSSNNAYYCWSKDSTKIIHLASSDKLTENVISNKRLVTIPPGNDRLSVLYHAEVEQYALRLEAYDYYFNLQKNIESSGSLFAPIPSEMKGNIRCVSDPDIPVIGYVEVATVTRTQRFMPEAKEMYEPVNTYCGSMIMTGEDAALYFGDTSFGFISYDPSPSSSVLAPLRCLDCRRRGSKDKPDWWPNEHF